MKRSDFITLGILLLLIYFLAKVIGRSDSNWDKLKTLNPSVRNNFVNFLNEVKAMGYTPVVTSSHRSRSEQAHLKKIDKRNASPGHSTHEHDTGIDVVLYYRKMVLGKSTPKKIWEATGIPELAINKYGMRWGGNFKGYSDPVHFDYL